MAAAKKRGPASKLTPEVGDRILALVRRGSHRETACATVGISSRTLRRWIERAEQGGPHSTRYKRFAEAMDKAEAEAEAITLSAIVHAGKEDWRALAWILERRGAQRWNSKRAAEKKDESKSGTLSDLIARRLEREGATRSEDLSSGSSAASPTTEIPGK